MTNDRYKGTRWTNVPCIVCKVREDAEAECPACQAAKAPEPPRAQIIDLGQALKRSLERS